jgi:hypothetical protein
VLDLEDGHAVARIRDDASGTCPRRAFAMCRMR